MKATLEFNLPEEKEEFETCTKAANYYGALSDLKQYLRTKAKYENVESINVAELREKLEDILSDNNTGAIV